MAHLIRDVRYLTTLPDRVTRAYGQRVLKSLKKVFELLRKRESMTEAAFRLAIGKARDAVLQTAKRVA